MPKYALLAAALAAGLVGCGKKPDAEPGGSTPGSATDSGNDAIPIGRIVSDYAENPADAKYKGKRVVASGVTVEKITQVRIERRSLVISTEQKAGGESVRCSWGFPTDDTTAASVKPNQSGVVFEGECAGRFPTEEMRFAFDPLPANWYVAFRMSTVGKTIPERLAFWSKIAADLDAAELMAEIASNPASTAKYQGLTVRITGRLKEVTSNLHRECFLTFDGKGHSPRCFFDNPADVSHLKPGDAITLQGALSTDGGTVDVGPCRLEKSIATK